MSHTFKFTIEPIYITIEDEVDGEPTGYTRNEAREVAIERFVDKIRSEPEEFIRWYVENTY